MGNVRSRLGLSPERIHPARGTLGSHAAHRAGVGGGGIGDDDTRDSGEGPPPAVWASFAVHHVALTPGSGWSLEQGLPRQGLVQAAVASLHEGLAPDPSAKRLGATWPVDSSCTQRFDVDPDRARAHRSGDEAGGVGPGDCQAAHVRWTSVGPAAGVAGLLEDDLGDGGQVGAGTVPVPHKKASQDPSGNEVLPLTWAGEGVGAHPFPVRQKGFGLDQGPDVVKDFPGGQGREERSRRRVRQRGHPHGLFSMAGGSPGVDHHRAPSGLSRDRAEVSP